MDQSITKPATIFLLEIESEDEALKLAQKVAEKTERAITVRNSNGELIVTVLPTRH